MLNIVIFFSLFILIAIIGLRLFLLFFNKKSDVEIEKFVHLSAKLNPIILRNIRLDYFENNGFKTYIYPKNFSDFYLFENYIGIVRWSNFGFKVSFRPLILAKDPTNINEKFFGYKVYKINSHSRKRVLNGVMEIHLIDPGLEHYKIELVLKNLTTTQIEQLDKLMVGG